MNILYNEEDKEVAIILGYGIGNHLSLNFLEEIVNSIKDLFPLLTLAQMKELKFLEVSRSSRRHKYHWYTKFPYDLSEYKIDKYDVNLGITDTINAYICKSHKHNPLESYSRPDETAAQLMDRLIHG